MCPGGAEIGYEHWAPGIFINSHNEVAMLTFKCQFRAFRHDHFEKLTESIVEV